MAPVLSNIKDQPNKKPMIAETNLYKKTETEKFPQVALNTKMGHFHNEAKK